VTHTHSIPFLFTQTMLRYLERWLPALTIRRASLFSERLEDSTGYSLSIVDHEGDLLFFLVDPYGDIDEGELLWAPDANIKSSISWHNTRLH
jgi:hypothetical protein